MLSQAVVRVTGPTGRRRAADLLQGSAVVFAGLLVVRGSGFYTRVLVGRSLGPSDLGIVSAFLAAVVVLGAVSSGGLQTTITTFSARYRVDADADALVRLRHFARSWQQAATVAIIIVAAGSVAWRGGGAGAIYQSAVLAATATCFVHLSVRIAWFRGAGDAVSSLLSNDLAKAVVHIGALHLLLVAGRLTVPTALAAALGSYLVALVAARLVPGAAALPAASLRIRPRFPPRRRLPSLPGAVERTWLRFAAPLAASTALQNTAGRSIDVLLLAMMVPAAEVGLYAAALTVSGLLGLALQAATFLALPDFASSDDPAAGYRARRRSLACWTLAGLAAWGAAAGSLVVPVFGDRFAPAAGLVAVFTVGHLASNVVGPVGPLTLAAGRSRLHLVADLAAIGTFWIVLHTFVPRHGVVAAAAARSLSQVVFNLLLAGITFRHFGIRHADPVVLVAAGVALLVAVAAVYLSPDSALSAATLAGLVLAATAGLVGLNQRVGGAGA